MSSDSRFQIPKRGMPQRLDLRFMVFALAFLFCFLAGAEQRFQPPEFEGGHQLPTTTTPLPRAPLLQYLDLAVLAGSLALAAWLVLKARSRKGLMALSIFSLLYFGFWREGCICSIGAVQNVALAVADRSYVLPITVAAFLV